MITDRCEHPKTVLLGNMLSMQSIAYHSHQNSKFNNTTILMYSIDQSQDTPTDLIISCSKDDLDMNLTDNNGENILFHLVNNDNFSDNIKIEFIKDFFLGDYNLYSKNNKDSVILCDFV